MGLCRWICLLVGLFVCPGFFSEMVHVGHILFKLGGGWVKLSPN